jgi:hypothetical protein
MYNIADSAACVSTCALLEWHWCRVSNASLVTLCVPLEDGMILYDTYVRYSSYKKYIFWTGIFMAYMCACRRNRPFGLFWHWSLVSSQWLVWLMYNVLWVQLGLLAPSPPPRVVEFMLIYCTHYNTIFWTPIQLWEHLCLLTARRCDTCHCKYFWLLLIAFNDRIVNSGLWSLIQEKIRACTIFIFDGC